MLLTKPTNLYTGVGSRKTPYDIQELFIPIGRYLAEQGFILRSGGAEGADSAFEYGCDSVGGKKEIYLPWERFNNNPSKLFTPEPKARSIAKRFHPDWKKCRKAVKLLHARNVHELLGVGCGTPSKFMICWTNGSGGTQQLIRIATGYGIPFCNVCCCDDKNEVWEFVEKNI